ncbi:MAG: hypothetical protein Kow0069_37770 [Promethearchaeota archaeon]
MRRGKIVPWLVLLLAVVSSAVVLFLAVGRTLDALADDPTTLAVPSEEVRMYWASLVVLLASTPPFVALVKSGGKLWKKSFDRNRAYALMVASRLWLVATLEWFRIRAYVDLTVYLTLPFEFYGPMAQNYPPVLGFFATFLSAQQVALFSFAPVTYDPIASVYVPALPRLTNLGLDLAVTFFLEQSVALRLTKDSSALLSDEGYEEAIRTKVVLLSAASPFTLVIAYVWCTPDMLVVLTNVLVVHELLQDRHASAGVFLALSTLTKLVGLLFVLPLAVSWVARRKWKFLAMASFGFAATCAVATVAYWLTLNPDLLEHNMVTFFLSWISEDRLPGFPFYDNAWLWLSRAGFPKVAVFSDALVWGVLLAYATRVRRFEFEPYQFVCAFAIFSALFWSFSPWWWVISATWFPPYLAGAWNGSERRPRAGVSKEGGGKVHSPSTRRAVASATWGGLAYWFIFVVLLLTLLSADPRLGHRATLRDTFFLKCPYFVWLATGYVTFLVAQVSLVLTGFKLAGRRDASRRESQRAEWKAKLHP